MKTSLSLVALAFVLGLAACDDTGAQSPGDTTDTSTATDTGAVDDTTAPPDGDSDAHDADGADGADGADDAEPGPVAGQCDGATPVPPAGLRVAGADFYADHSDALRFDEPTCAQVRLLAPTHVERVFEVGLAAGQSVGVCQRGAVPTVTYVVRGCEDEPIACEAAAEVDQPCLVYTAAVAEVVFVVVEAYFDATEATDYDVHVGFDPTCGDGVVEPGEGCDDGGTAPGDGCDASCDVEGGWVCHADDEGGASLCFAEGCGDGVLIEHGSGNEECDDRNLEPGDGCDASCDVEDGWNCGAFAGPDACWEEPHYAVGPTSAEIVETWPGILLTRYHDGLVTFAEATRLTGEAAGVAKETGASSPMRFELVPEQGGVIVINVQGEPATWEQVIAPGTYRFRVRSDEVHTLGEYTLRFGFGAP